MTKHTDSTKTKSPPESRGSPGVALLEAGHPYNDARWGVHVLGPDNVLAARSFDEAVARCHEINSMLINYIINNPRFSDEYSPRVFAQVAIWEDIANFPHDPDKTDWANACA